MYRIFELMDAEWAHPGSPGITRFRESSGKNSDARPL